MAWRCSSASSLAKSAATSSRRCASHASSSASDVGDVDVDGDTVNAGDAGDAGDADTSAPPPLARSGELLAPSSVAPSTAGLSPPAPAAPPSSSPSFSTGPNRHGPSPPPFLKRLYGPPSFPHWTHSLAWSFPSLPKWPFTCTKCTVLWLDVVASSSSLSLIASLLGCWLLVSIFPASGWLRTCCRR